MREINNFKIQYFKKLIAESILKEKEISYKNKYSRTSD